MFTTLFKEIKDGKMQRMTYFVLTIAIILVIFILFIPLLLLAEMIDETLGITPYIVYDDLTITAIILLTLIMAPLFFASINITAKRLRDIGLPGWWTQLLMLGLSSLIYYLFNDFHGNLFDLITAIAIFITPSEIIKGQTPLPSSLPK